MFTREKYCAVCGCLFNLPLLRNPDNPDPTEDEMLALNNPYDLRVLPRDLTTVNFPTPFAAEMLIKQIVAYGLSRGRSLARPVSENLNWKKIGC